MPCSKVKMWQYPLEHPRTYQLLWTILSWPLIYLVAPTGVSHIFLRHKKTTGEWEKKNKEQPNIKGLCQLKCKKGGSVTLHSLCIRRCTLTCILRKISTSHAECWLILTGLPSLLLDPISCRLASSAVRCRLQTALLRHPSPTASLEEGKSYSEIAGIVRMSKSIAHRIISRFMADKILEPKPSTGKPPLSTKREDQMIVKMSLKDRFDTATSISCAFCEQTEKPITRKTVFRILN